MTPLFELGSVVKPHGIKGDLVIYINTDLPFRNKLPPSVFIGSDTANTEFQLVSARIKDHLATIHLKGIDSRNDAELYIKKKVYLLSSELPATSSKEFLPTQVIGFTLNDVSAGDLGSIIKVYELPQHPVFAIEYKGKEALIPATDEFIIRIDKKNKIFYMDLPEGLLDIYA